MTVSENLFTRFLLAESKKLLVVFFIMAIASCANSQQKEFIPPSAEFEKVWSVKTNEGFPETGYLTMDANAGVFPIVKKGVPSQVLVSDSDFDGVLKIAEYFRKDLSNVSGGAAELIIGEKQKAENLIIIGTLGKSKLIDGMVSKGKIDLSSLTGKNEQFLIQTIENPIKGVKKALVIAGSDKRGTIYGMLDLSEKMGVSPWYWWADVPVKVRENIYVKAGEHTLGEPAVKYRGIFINDEAPALTGWTYEKFGEFNHHFYEKVFELILRMKGNFLWPAMWGRSLWDDDSLSAPLADKMGIVLSTSHHEPLMRSHVEWSRYGEGPWNYEKNPEKLRQFWKDGIERMNGYESVVTLAMRGDGDEAMSEETATGLLEQIVVDQRKIIEEVTGKPAVETPQVWALYKEVQEYYDKGMRVPDDVTLLLCDDNWGNVRVLPQINSKPRKGGYGMYYHFDFVGGPRSYKWLNTTQIERVWEQMHLTYEYGVDEIWLVNVGDLKPMEFPINFFLDYAWNPNQWPAEKLPDYYSQWAAKQFGQEHAKEIGEIISLYTKYNSRRKPEMLEPSTYSLQNFNEAEKVMKDYNGLVERVNKIAEKLPPEAHDAFYQLVVFPVTACANINEMYVLAAKNHLYAQQGRVSTNDLAKKVEANFNKDAELSNSYHTELGNGKWNHIMAQIRIGYTSWNQPKEAVMPDVETIDVKPTGQFGVTLPGIESWWPEAGGNITLPRFDSFNKQTQKIELFNQGETTVSYKIEPKNDWITIDTKSGNVETEIQIGFSIDWAKAPKGISQGKVTVTSGEISVNIILPVNNKEFEDVAGFVENNGIISIEATDFQNAIKSETVSWEIIPNLGRTGSSVTSVPVTAPKQELKAGSPSLEYEVYILDSGLYDLTAYLSPTLNFQKDEGLLYAFSIDNAEPVIVNMHKDATIADWKYPDWWNNAVTENIMRQTVLEKDLSSGSHTIKYWMVDPGIVLQKIVLKKKDIDANSYLGPPESSRID